MPTGARFALTILIVLAALLGLSLCGYNYWDSEPREGNLFDAFRLASAETRPELCMDEATRERIRGVMFDALDESLRQHIVHMFEVWMKDDRGQPERARTGVQNGMRAYLNARKGAAEWMPPPCAG